jgi:hypothetical protein
MTLSNCIILTECPKIFLPYFSFSLLHRKVKSSSCIFWWFGFFFSCETRECIFTLKSHFSFLVGLGFKLRTLWLQSPCFCNQLPVQDSTTWAIPPSWLQNLVFLTADWSCFISSTIYWYSFLFIANTFPAYHFSFSFIYGIFSNGSIFNFLLTKFVTLFPLYGFWLVHFPNGLVSCE